MDNYMTETFTAGRRLMLDAFVELSDMALRAGADEQAITALHGRFFDGNVKVKSAFGAAVLLLLITTDDGGDQ